MVWSHQESVDAPVRRCESINLPGYKRGRGWPKRSWREAIRYDLKFIGLAEDITQDRSMRKFRIKVASYR